jgi:hypothetical protein
MEGKGRGLICIIPSLGMCLERGLLVASRGHFSGITVVYQALKRLSVTLG